MVVRDAGVAASLADRVRPTSLARDRRLPVLPALEPLLPGGGLPRGSTVAVAAAAGVTGATSLALALVAGPSQDGSWVVAVGLGSLGLVAAAELGIALERFVLVGDPGHARGADRREAGGRGGWPPVIAALVDGFDVVLVGAGPRSHLRAGDARRLVARARERGAVLVSAGGDLAGQCSPSCLTVTAATWEGLGAGWGHLRGRRVTVEAAGRGAAARPRRAGLWLPGADGSIAAVEPAAEPVLLRRAAVAARAPARAGGRARRGVS